MFRKTTALCAALLFSLTLAGPTLADEKPLEIAITFDDLPSHGYLPEGMTRTDIANNFISAQKAAGAPPMYGFINAYSLDWDPNNPKTLELWRKAGNLLGNHTYSHPSATKATAEEFEADIGKNEPFLKKYMAGEDWHYLRLPYLDMGDTPQKRQANHDWMKAHGYRLADVTMGFNDWDFNAAYVRCVKAGDQKQIRWLKTHYLISFAHGVERGRDSAQRVWGRQIKHVYLLHFGALDSIMFPKVLAYLKAKNVRLITLPEAESDPVYAENDLVTDNWGGYLENRVAVKKGIPLPNDPDISGDKLAAMCKVNP